MDTFGQLGIGGALVLLALAQMFAFLKARKNGVTTAAQCPMSTQVELWESRLTNAIADGISRSLKPLFEAQAETLRVQARSLEKIIDNQNQLLFEQMRLCKGLEERRQ
jgi:hypothetical protein